MQAALGYKDLTDEWVLTYWHQNSGSSLLHKNGSPPFLMPNHPLLTLCLSSNVAKMILREQMGTGLPSKIVKSIFSKRRVREWGERQVKIARVDRPQRHCISSLQPMPVTFQPATA